MKQSLTIATLFMAVFLMGFPDQLLAESCTEGNCIDGKGTLTQSDGSTYVGEFKNSMYEGYGTRTSSVGSKYVGHFKKGKFDGQGTLTSSDGKIYVGEFKDGMKEGIGSATLPIDSARIKYEPNG